MNYTNLGRTGIKVSRLCLGCMSFGVPQRGGHPGRGAESSFHQACPGPRHQLPRHPNSYSDGTRGRSSAGPSANSPGATRW